MNRGVKISQATTSSQRPPFQSARLRAAEICTRPAQAKTSPTSPASSNNRRCRSSGTVRILGRRRRFLFGTRLRKQLFQRLLWARQFLVPALLAQAHIGPPIIEGDPQADQGE